MKVIDLGRIMILFQRQTDSEEEMLYHQLIYIVCLNERKKAAGQFLFHVQVEAGLYS